MKELKLLGIRHGDVLILSVQGLLSAVNDMDIFMLIVTITVMGA